MKSKQFPFGRWKRRPAFISRAIASVICQKSLHSSGCFQVTKNFEKDKQDQVSGPMVRSTVSTPNASEKPYEERLFLLNSLLPPRSDHPSLEDLGRISPGEIRPRISMGPWSWGEQKQDILQISTDHLHQMDGESRNVIVSDRSAEAGSMWTCLLSSYFACGCIYAKRIWPCTSISGPPTAPNQLLLEPFTLFGQVISTYPGSPKWSGKILQSFTDFKLQFWLACQSGIPR